VCLKNTISQRLGKLLRCLLGFLGVANIPAFCLNKTASIKSVASNNTFESNSNDLSLSLGVNNNNKKKSP